ncbi:MAG: ribosome-associated translation inhibitor RaiA [Lentisphaerae bacterium]|nr:ribosome-associated translation inhibitor RaiA [Lentisphaerota bacterium]
MDMLIHTDGVTLTKKLEGAIEEKIGRLEQYAPRALRTRVKIRKVSAHAGTSQFVVGVLIEVPGSDISAEEKGPEPMAALDLVSEKLESRLRKIKTRRLRRRHHDTSAAIEAD